MNYIKHMAIDFAKKNNLYGKGISFQKLLNVARQNGYIVLDYSQRAKLILFDLYDRAKDSSSVSIVDECGNAIIFLNQKLPVSKQLFGLAHEIGHIILKHPLGEQEKRKYENEANQFAHYLLNSAYDDSKYIPIITALLAIISICICTIFVILVIEVRKSPSQPETSAYNDEVIITVPSGNSEYKPNINTPSTQTPSTQTPSKQQPQTPQTPSDSTTCYYTESGRVYHLYRDCYHIKNSKEVHSSIVGDNPKPRVCETCKSRKDHNEQ